jgi:hypothetical protein
MPKRLIGNTSLLLTSSGTALFGSFGGAYLKHNKGDNNVQYG